jgi:outer membrane immunogenic protein
MFIPFTAARPPARRAVLAACLFATAAVPLACGATAAAAADMAVKTAAAPAPKYQWTGCYGGLNGGGGTSASNVTTTVNPGTHLVPADVAEVSNDGTGSANSSNFVGGGQAGCIFQTGTVVVGLEGDFDYFHTTSSFYNNTNMLPVAGVPFVIGQSVTTNYLATVRPRFGVAADRNLAYITGGVAFTRASYTESYVDTAAPAGTGIATASKSLIGWTAGAGWEYALSDHVTFRLEYLFTKFGTTSALGAITDAGGGTNPLLGSADLVLQTARAGVNLKF